MRFPIVCSAWTLALFFLLAAPAGAQSMAEADRLSADASRLYQAGRYAEATPLAEKALRLIEKKHGLHDVLVGNSCVSLATIYLAQNRFDEAESLYKRALEIFTNKFGLNHLETAPSRSGLFSLYKLQHEYAKAEQELLLLLIVYEKSLGERSVQVAQTLGALGGILSQQSRFEESEIAMLRSLNMFESVLGRSHPMTAQATNNVATLYATMGRLQEATSLAQSALSIFEATLGPNHPEVGTVLGNLASLHLSAADLRKALEFQERALHILERSYGVDSVNITTQLANLANIHSAMGRHALAEPFLRRAVSIAERRLGAQHPQSALLLGLLASQLAGQDRLDEAGFIAAQVHATLHAALGADHIRVGEALQNLARIRFAQHRFDEALELQKQSVLVIEKVLGPEHRMLADALGILSTIQQRLGFSGDSQKSLERGVEMAERIYGKRHPQYGRLLSLLAEVHLAQGELDKTEELLQHSLAIIEEKMGVEHLDAIVPLNNLGIISVRRNSLSKAVAFFGKSTKAAERHSAIEGQGMSNWGRDGKRPLSVQNQFVNQVKVLYRYLATNHGSRDGNGQVAFESSQRAHASEAAASLAQMSARSAGGSLQLATLVRERQDLVAEWQGKDKLLIATKGEAPAKRNASGEKELSDRLAAIDGRLGEIDARLAKEFPDYAALVSPKPISVADAHVSLRDGEALVLFLDTDDRFKPLPEETFIWVVTKTDMKWVRSDLGTGALQREVTALRCGLDASAWADSAKWSEATDEDRRRKLAQQARRDACIKATGVTVSEDALPPFDAARAHALYKGLFGEVEDLIRGKHLLVVPSGPLTQLPLHVLVTEPPAPDTALKDIAFLGARQPITVLPSAASLKSLRRDAKPSRASEPFIGFGNPTLAGNPNCGKITIPDRCPNDPAPAAEAASRMLGRLVASLNTVTAYFSRSGQADVESVRKLCPLPDSAHELACVAKSLGAGADNMVIGPAMTEPAVRRAKLDRYRVLHFATHGLLAGEMSAMAKGKAEPALVFTPPEVASEEDDGLLTASEITTLKLDADWVVMSACNTAAGGASGAEALSGLAKAFFYAGARALLVSHWPVNSYAATMLTSTTFAELKRDPKIGRAEAFRRAMVALIKDTNRSWAAHPSIWAPFAVVGEGGAG